MDKANPLILNVKPLTLPKLIIETNDGYYHTSDLSEFKNVFCFPKTQKEWETVSPDADGIALIWSTRFEVHVDQIIPNSEKVEPIKHVATK